MIVERLTFQAKYGQGDALVALNKEVFALMKRRGLSSTGRIYTDATGTMFTVALEQEFADMAAYAKAFAGDTAMYADKEFQDWFAKMVAVTEKGERQLFNVETVS
jgi:hypothetical protein